MRGVNLSEVIDWLGGDVEFRGSVPERFSELVFEVADMRSESGFLFLPAESPLYDCRNEIDKAIKEGAAAVVIDSAWLQEHECPDVPLVVVNEHPYELFMRAYEAKRDCLTMPIVAVSGSAGKTTTRELIAAFLRGAGRVWETSENDNGGGGICSLIMQAQNPDYIVAEVGISEPHSMKPYCRLLKPTVATLTSIGSAHVGKFKNSRELLAKEKAKIFDKLWGKEGFGVISREIGFFDLVKAKSNVPLVEVSTLYPTASYYGEVLDESVGVMKISERRTGLQTEITIGRPGRYLCENALLAFAIARELGVTPEQCLSGLKTFSVPGNRWRKVEKNGVLFVDDTFNANEAAMIAVADAFSKMVIPEGGRRVLVLGDMAELGGLAEECHRHVGESLVGLPIDFFMTVGPLASKFMGEEYEKRGGVVHRAADTDAAIGILRSYLKSGDVVLVKASHAMHLDSILENI